MGTWSLETTACSKISPCTEKKRSRGCRSEERERSSWHLSLSSGRGKIMTKAIRKETVKGRIVVGADGNKSRLLEAIDFVTSLLGYVKMATEARGPPPKREHGNSHYLGTMSKLHVGVHTKSCED